MNEWIHPHLPISRFLSLVSYAFKVPEPLTPTFLKTLCSFFSTFSEMVHGYPSFRGRMLSVLFLSPCCFPLCAITTPLLCSLASHPVQTLLPFAKAVKPDFTLVFLSSSFLNSVLHNRAKLILSSVLWLPLSPCVTSSPTEDMGPWGYDFVSFIFLFFFYILT